MCRISEYKVSKYYGFMLNDNYTGLIHMVGYYDSNNRKDRGIMFLSHLFDKPNVIGKTSFISQNSDSILLDSSTIENEFGVEIIYSKDGQSMSVNAGDKSYYLYDDEIGTSTRKKISFEDTPIVDSAQTKMFSNLNRAKRAKKVLEGEVYFGQKGTAYKKTRTLSRHYTTLQ